MNNSSQRQELRQQQRGALRRSTIFALLAVACLSGVATQIPHLLQKWPQWQEQAIAWSARQGFTLENVELAGRNTVPVATIAQVLNVQRGMPIFAYDIQTAQTKLAENPWFKSVTVERRLPDTIFVNVTERIPAARWQVNGKLALVDRDGVVLTTDNLDRYQVLPLIVGQEARHKIADLFTLLNGEPVIAREVTAATWVSNRRWDLTLKNGITVKLPAEQPELALSQLAAYDHNHQVFGRDIKTVDLRLPDKAILQPTTRANLLIERPDFSDTPDRSKKNI